MLSNEAIVRGALEAGVGFASTYPGTPASEIGDTFARISKDAGIYFEYSANEKVALEAAAGAAFCGVRSIVSMKHFGLNVAADSFMPIAYVGTNPMVIVSADDPNCWSSAQSEQDNRFYARLAHVPMLEPSDPQEAKDFTKLAFDISEKFEIPVLLRETTRVSHTRGVVKLGRIVKGKTRGEFIKDLKRFNNLPPHTMEMHERILKKIEKIRKVSEKTKLNFFLNKGKRSDFGIIVSGVSFNYVMDALNDLDVKLPILKLGLTYPLPRRKIGGFIKKLHSVLIVEELEPLIEEEVHM
ncbi:MAG: indolepyruvate ferredoxin oxidoreductase subunit alpha, partial [Methanobacteriota archaeon]